MTLESTGEKTSFLDQLDTYFESLSEPSSETGWIKDYVLWHYHFRQEFPDTQLFDHPEAPPLMIRWYHTSHGGGLTDRSKCLGDFLQQAYQAKRVLLVKWFHAPTDLEEFLEPRYINFTLPHHTTTDNETILEGKYGSIHGNREKYEQRIVSLPFCGCKIEYLPPFHVIWHMLFRPAPPVKRAIENTMSLLNITPGKYDAVHCRVTHPAFREMTTVDAEMLAADQQGAYEFIGDNKKASVEAAVHGVLCASWIRNLTLPTENTSSEIYFFSDSQELVRFMIAGQQDLSNQTNDELALKVAQVQSQFRIVGRSDSPVAHLQNFNEDVPFDAFVSAFVDIYIASKAKCLSLGVGNYGRLSTKINSGDNMCLVRHQNVARKVMLKWGSRAQLEVPLCSI